MRNALDRRGFVQVGMGAGLLAGLGDLSFLNRLPAVAAEETKLDPQGMLLRPEIEPLVRLLEETPRDRLLEVFGERIRAGLSYREVLAALLLAGVKNIEPRPAVGFKFHAVLVVNLAHLASQLDDDRDRPDAECDEQAHPFRINADPSQRLEPPHHDIHHGGRAGGETDQRGQQDERQHRSHDDHGALPAGDGRLEEPEGE